MIYGITAIILILIFLFCYYQNNKIDITEYSVSSEKLNNDMKVAHLSDMHSKPFHKVIEKLTEIRPDAIMITGDYINDHCKNNCIRSNFSELLHNLMKWF